MNDFDKQRLPFDTIVFDLDDTLTDTEGQLVSKARSESLAAMIREGLNISPEGGEKLWKEYLLNPPRVHDVFEFLADTHPVPEERSALAKAGREVFYRRDVPSTFHALIEGVELLSKLKSRYDLYLVTSGDVATQKKKVEITKISHYFNKIFYVDHMAKEGKAEAFQKILLHHDLPPGRILCIGNRLDHEIREGNRLGFKTCWVRRGEHRFQQPLLQEDTPHFTVDHIHEVYRKCQL